MIFGGFLLKSTFELAFTCASATSHSRPSFIALDPSTFENPVPVGSVLYLTATVAYSDSPLVSSGDKKASPEGSTRIQVRVESKIRNIEHGETKPTGQFSKRHVFSSFFQLLSLSLSLFFGFLLRCVTNLLMIDYTFEVPKDIKIIPESYSEFMMYLDARRRVNRTNASLKVETNKEESVME